MVCLPGIVEPGTFTAEVADSCGCSNMFGSTLVVLVVIDGFLGSTFWCVFEFVLGSGADGPTLIAPGGP